MENSVLQISKEFINRIYSHSKRDYPYECCGILIGDFETRKVEEILEANNLRKDREDRFEIAPEDLLKGEKIARDRSMDVIGYYHSHPDHPDEPSEYDRARAFPGMSYIIVSVLKGKETLSRSWILSEKDFQFQEEKINIT
ncbi:MAG: M67 family metallopeptidase [Spirochaetota bacterium]|nr:M67 family metallopeptidase [Spirochaetota bacterium]